MNLSIVIVSWNVKQKLYENLQAIFNSQFEYNLEVFVVDNNSQDQTVAMIQENFPKVRVIANPENLGFAKANNQAIKQSTGRYILLLNPDMRVGQSTLQDMLDWMEQNPQASVAGCHLTNELGQTQPHVRRFPGILDQLAIVLKLPHIVPTILNKYLMPDFDYSRAARVDSVRGSFFMLRRDDAKLPLLDERYFIWFEEVDYCRQISLAGKDVWYTPAATCVDYVGGSFSQVARGTTQAYFKDSMLKYFKKWQPAWQYCILRLAWPLGGFIVMVAQKINFKSQAKT